MLKRNNGSINICCTLLIFSHYHGQIDSGKCATRNARTTYSVIPTAKEFRRLRQPLPQNFVPREGSNASFEPSKNFRALQDPLLAALYIFRKTPGFQTQ